MDILLKNSKQAAFKNRDSIIVKRRGPKRSPTRELNRNCTKQKSKNNLDLSNFSTRSWSECSSKYQKSKGRMSYMPLKFRDAPLLPILLPIDSD